MAKMSAKDFFQKGKVGQRIRYGSDDSPEVDIFIFSRGAMYAWGEEDKTGRRIFLFLRDWLLVDRERGEFGVVEILAE